MNDAGTKSVVRHFFGSSKSALQREFQIGFNPLLLFNGSTLEFRMSFRLKTRFSIKSIIPNE